MGVRGGQDQRAGAAHLLVQQADGVVLGIVGAQRVGADQLGAVVGLVRLGRAQWPHLVQHDRDAGLRQVPGGLAAGKAGADDVDGAGMGCGHGASDKGWAGAPQAPSSQGLAAGSVPDLTQAPGKISFLVTIRTHDNRQAGQIRQSSDAKGGLG